MARVSVHLPCEKVPDVTRLRNAIRAAGWPDASIDVTKQGPGASVLIVRHAFKDEASSLTVERLASLVKAQDKRAAPPAAESKPERAHAERDETRKRER